MAAVKPTKPRNRLAQDLTRINLRQVNRRLGVLERQVKHLLTALRDVLRKKG